MKIIFIVYLYTSCLKVCLKQKFSYNGCRFMRPENAFALLYIYSYKKISAELCEAFGKAFVA
jgi:hypothetical protein